MDVLNESYEDVYKIVIIGATLVGKTTFLSTYLSINNHNLYKQTYNDFEAKIVELESGKKVNVQV